MKLQIDIDNKTISVEDAMNLEHLFNLLNNMFPNEVWKEFTLQPKIIKNWNNPIIIKEHHYQPNVQPYNPDKYTKGTPYWEYIPTITYGNLGKLTLDLNSNNITTDRILNVEL